MTKEELKGLALEVGFSALGVASADSQPHWEFYRDWVAKGFGAEMDYLANHLEMKRSVKSLLPQAKSVIMVALDYNQPVKHQEGEPKIARYALGRDYHKVIRGKLRKLGIQLQKDEPESLFRVCVDSAPMMERDFANLAGLGWFGKNTCLIDSHRGSWFFLGAILTSLEFEADQPAVGGCGTCTLCIDACPTGAIVFGENRWQVDARRCISYLTIEKKGDLEHGLAGWTFGCDICQEVCPFNTPRESQPKRGALATDPDLLRVRKWPNLQQLAMISDNEWDELTQGSAVRRTGREGLARNARLNLTEAPKGAPH